MATITAAPTLHRRIAGSAGIVMASVMLSRLLGFLREWTLAHQVGSNASTDSYYAAFTLPDFLNYLVAGASLSVIFIPVFTKYVTENKEDEAWHVFSTVMTFMALLLITVVALAEIFAPHLVNVISPGFTPEAKERVVQLTRIMLPAQVCFVLGSILSAVQYAKSQFLVPSLATVIYNLFIILGGWFLFAWVGISGFAIGVLTGAIVGNLLLQIYGAYRVGARFQPNLQLRHPGFILFIKMAVPIMLALSLSACDDWIVRWFGSYLHAASITWLSYAKTLMRVPLTAIGQAVGVASFPLLTQLYSEGKFDELNNLLNSTVKGLLLLIVPISALTMAQSETLIYFVFANTRLHGADFQATAYALAIFSFAMFAWGAQYIFSRGFYATHNTWTPAIVGTVVMLFSLPLYAFLVHRYQYIGLAVASSIAIICYMLVLFLLLNRHTHNRQAGRVVLFFSKISVASAVAGVACYRLTLWFQPHVPWHTRPGALFLLILVTGVGCLLIAAMAKLLGISELDAYFQRLGARFGMKRYA
ncbi:MAG TPA: murein biosynthesis integral membrane protein MurJ [Terriglobales bacterium]|nr:murein biosynthesis integral membrane protein MurJ [Terriglobales bacterium]